MMKPLFHVGPATSILSHLMFEYNIPGFAACAYNFKFEIPDLPKNLWLNVYPREMFRIIMNEASAYPNAV